MPFQWVLLRLGATGTFQALSNIVECPAQQPQWHKEGQEKQTPQTTTLRLAFTHKMPPLNTAAFVEVE
jgi:hypothetical protein